ncbi:MAG: transcription elongation factor GreB [Betaproteobacteria bacterium RIFCSPLOWO2_02_FULL_66_14]|nr:MAG: transcription elongation factor GreB [Betaproteobacteria bacterium RIFCSPLOWO2_02_FULL_66_14]
MSKAFVREPEGDEANPGDAGAVESHPANPQGRNYISPAGYARLRAELKSLVEAERPRVVQAVAWAASNGDRSENGDYLYGKKRLREIDRRVRFLIKRLEAAEIVRSAGRASDQVYFGATVTVAGADGERTVTIAGVDEVNPAKGRISWVSPMARALLKAREGERVVLRTPVAAETLEILRVRYLAID